MKLGVFVGFGAHTPPELIAGTGRVAEERDLHSLWAPEHVLVFREYASRYPYSEDGRIPFGPMGLADPFDVLHFLCGLTSRIRLGTGICIVPQRNPLVLAKQLSSMDHISGGRLVLGMASGWYKREFDAVGVDFHKRGKIMDQNLDIMCRLWTEDTVDMKAAKKEATTSPRSPAGR